METEFHKMSVNYYSPVFAGYDAGAFNFTRLGADVLYRQGLGGPRGMTAVRRALAPRGRRGMTRPSPALQTGLGVLLC